MNAKNILLHLHNLYAFGRWVTFIRLNTKGQSKNEEIILKKVDTLEFFGIGIKVPDGCTAESTGKYTYKVNCSNYHYSISIVNVAPPDIFPSLVEETVKKLENQSKNFKKTKIVGYLGPDTVSGYKMSYSANNKMVFIIMAFKKRKNNALYFDFYSDRVFEKNSDLPDPVKTIFRILE